MKNLILSLFCALSMGVSSQNVPIIETDISVPFSFTDQELLDNKEYYRLINKYSSLWYGDSLRLEIPSEDRIRLEELGPIMEEGPIWSTRPIGCSWYCAAMHWQTVSSFLAPQKNNIYDASSIFDWDVQTAWVVNGYGIGEYVEVAFPANTQVRATSCYIVNGYNKNETTWKNNSRVKSMDLYLDGTLIAHVNLKDTRDQQFFMLPDTIPLNTKDLSKFKTLKVEYQEYLVSTLKFEITDVYKGDKYEDTAISELSFNGVGDH